MINPPPSPTRFRQQFTWRVVIKTSVSQAYDFLTTDAGRRRFWCADSISGTDQIQFSFHDGTTFTSRILHAEKDSSLELTYLGGGRPRFELTPVPPGHCIVSVTDMPDGESDWLANYAGWVAVLLNLKAVLEFGVDLRLQSADRTFEKGFADG